MAAVVLTEPKPWRWIVVIIVAVAGIGGVIVGVVRGSGCQLATCHRVKRVHHILFLDFLITSDGTVVLRNCTAVRTPTQLYNDDDNGKEL